MRTRHGKLQIKCMDSKISDRSSSSTGGDRRYMRYKAVRNVHFKGTTSLEQPTLIMQPRSVQPTNERAAFNTIQPKQLQRETKHKRSFPLHCRQLTKAQPTLTHQKSTSQESLASHHRSQPRRRKRPVSPDYKTSDPRDTRYRSSLLHPCDPQNPNGGGELQRGGTRIPHTRSLRTKSE